MFIVTQFFDALCVQGARDVRPLVDADAIAAELGVSDAELLPVLTALQRRDLVEDVHREAGERMMRLTAHGLAIYRGQPEALLSARTEGDG